MYIGLTRVTTATNVPSNPYYSRVNTKISYEMVNEYEEWKIDPSDTAPCGVKFSVKLDYSESTLDGVITKYNLQGDDGIFTATFGIMSRLYELTITFKDGKPYTACLEEWLDEASFEDGDDCDVTYTSDDKLKIESYNS